MFHSQIRPCVKWTYNVHIYIKYNIGTSKHDFFVQVWNFLLPLSLKVLRHKEREAQSFYSGLFICTPILCNTCPRPPRASKNQPSSPEAGLISTLIFLKFSQNPPHASGPWRHVHCVAPFPISGYCDIPEWHVRRAHMKSCVNVAPK